MEQFFRKPVRMNRDDDYSVMPPTDAEEIRNLFSDIYPEGKLSNAMGTRQEAAPVGGNIACIGSVEDKENDRIITFIWDSGGNHSIWARNLTAQTDQLVLLDAHLQFDREAYLDAHIKDGMLYWCQYWFSSFLEDGNGNQQLNPPRKINIDQAINFYLGTSDYSNIDYRTTLAEKWPLQLCPTCTYTTDPNRKSNSLKGRLFQFIVQYVYDDNEESRWSPVSKVAIPTFPETMEGLPSSQIQQDNRIDLVFNSGHHTIKRIRVAVREGNIGAWGIFREIDKDRENVVDNANITLFFYNDENRKPVEITLQNYDLSPIVAGTMEMLHNKELVYGRIKEGHDLITPDMSASYAIEEIVNGGEGMTIHNITAQNISVVPHIRGLIFNENWKEGLGGTDDYFIPEGTVFLYTVKDTSLNVQYEQSKYVAIQDYKGLTELSVFLDLWRIYLNSFYPADLSFSIVSLNTLQCQHTVSNDIQHRMVVQMPNERFRSWKTGSVHPVGIQYYDGLLRDSTVITNNDCRVYVKTPAEEDTSGLTFTESMYKTKLVLTVNHQPPEWAKYYQVVYSGNATKSSWQYRSVRKTETDISTPGRTKISLERFYMDNYEGAKYHHEIMVGDRVRFIRVSHPESLSASEYIDSSNDFEVEVLKYDPSSGDSSSEAIWVELFDWNSIFGSFKGYMIEIYRPQKQDAEDLVWHEIGEVFTVQNPHTANRIHEGQTIGGSPTPATIDLEGGDTYIRLRRTGTGYLTDPFNAVSWYVEDPHYSDYWSSKITDRGRVAIKDVRARSQNLENSLRASQKYIDGTFVNGLSTFDVGKLENLPEEFGPIQRIVEVGATLKVICSRKVFSIYIDRQESFAADGGSLEFVRNTFGTVRPHEENWGTEYPHSVCKYNRSVYFLDNKEAVFVEANANGLMDIASGEFKMKDYFRRLRTTIFGALTNVNPEIYIRVGAGSKYKQVWVSIKVCSNGTVLTEETTVFSAEKRYWLCHLDMSTEMFVSNGDRFFSYDTGALYEHEEARRGFYGTDVDGTVRVYFNDKYPFNKIPFSLEVEGANQTGLYPVTDSPCEVTMETPEREPYPSQRTVINPHYFQMYEGKYRSFVLGDQNDPGCEIPTTNVKQWNSRAIRGNWISVNLSGIKLKWVETIKLMCKVFEQ